MLDLLSITKDIREAGKRERERHDSLAETVSLALAMARMESQVWRETHVPRLRTADSKRLFAHAEESPCIAYPAPEPPHTYVAVAVDGSQIVPDRDDSLASSYLLNYGQVVLRYGTGQRPTLKSVPELHPLPNDDDERTEVLKSLAVKRYGAEMLRLAALSVETRIQDNLPTIALSDGSLIAWFIGGDQDDDDMQKQDTLNDLFGAFGTTMAAGIPLVGYISGPRSRDVVCSLRATLCDCHPLICTTCEQAGERPLCHTVLGLRDADLFAPLLKSGERSPVFTSQEQMSGQSQILARYNTENAAYWVCFFYLNVGREIARIEFPCWIATQPALVDFVHATCLDQARKGMGYPVALTEAHEMAVIRGADREAFSILLQRANVDYGMAGMTRTRKSMNKRIRPL